MTHLARQVVPEVLHPAIAKRYAVKKIYSRPGIKKKEKHEIQLSKRETNSNGGNHNGQNRKLQ
jgi:hypothetical protein